MHLIISIALGIFAGLWLFVRWLEWREAWWERRELRQIARAERQAERERATAEHEAKLAREAAERLANQSPTRVLDCLVALSALLAIFVTGSAVLFSLH